MDSIFWCVISLSGLFFFVCVYNCTYWSLIIGGPRWVSIRPVCVPHCRSHPLLEDAEESRHRSFKTAVDGVHLVRVGSATLDRQLRPSVWFHFWIFVVLRPVAFRVVWRL